MKNRFSIFIIILSILGFGQVSISSAAPIYGSLQFNGFCDGLSINFDPPTGRVWGTATGCLDGEPVLGVGANIIGQGLGLVISYNCCQGVSVIRMDGTFSTYTGDGGSMNEVNSGTWSWVISPF